MAPSSRRAALRTNSAPPSPALLRHDSGAYVKFTAARRRAVRLMAAKGWSKPFDDPIPLPRGRQLVTLKDAARYIQKLPKAEQKVEEWQTAIEALILVAESKGGPTMRA